MTSDTVRGRAFRGQFKVAALRFVWDGSGTTAIEYAIIGALIGVGVAAAVSTLGGAVTDLYGTVVASFS